MEVLLPFLFKAPSFDLALRNCVDILSVTTPIHAHFAARNLAVHWRSTGSQPR